MSNPFPKAISHHPNAYAQNSVTPPITVSLRKAVLSDVPVLFEMQLDPASNLMAGTKPRDRAAFEAIWDGILRGPLDPGSPVTPRVILADGVFVGMINTFPQEGTPSLGYWIVREHWGRGIATRAIALMVTEVSTRPMHARVVATNAASLRALEHNGFAVIERAHTKETERYTAAEVVMLRLDR
jgi:RimJ/RimL family protein N-acetyltransferase